jgi:hypothetical protein
MQRPDLATLACVNPACQWFRLTGQDNLTVRKVYGQDHIRLLRCRTCGEEFSERRGTTLINAGPSPCPMIQTKEDTRTHYPCLIRLYPDMRGR